jgi:hypothetical protein
MPHWFYFWAGWLLVGLTYEVWAVWFHPSPLDTLSEFTVYCFHTRTRLGWGLFLAFIAGLAAWYPAHIRNIGGPRRRPPA